MGGANFVLKSIISSALIISTGYVLMVQLTPSKESLKQEILKHRELEKNDDVYKLQIKMIKENAKSDNPIWMVKFPTRQDLENSRREGDQDKDINNKPKK